MATTLEGKGTSNDLLIIGAGRLGRRIARSWRKTYPSAEIVAETRTTTSHDILKSINVTPNLAGTPTQSFPNVVFCIPPGPVPDYSEAVKEATQRVLPGGRFVFTSSTSVYGDIKFADEHTPTTDTPRGKRIVEAENSALGIPGCTVVRLPGMYEQKDCIHSYSISRGEVYAREESIWNLIHFEDAAEAVICVLLLGELSERIFLASAAKEITRGEHIDGILRHPRNEGKKRPQFWKDGPVLGRKHDNALARRILGWKPRYESFVEFVDEELRRLDSD